ncbi:unnamed protein product [Ectocarpus fasciculatus]
MIPQKTHTVIKTRTPVAVPSARLMPKQTRRTRAFGGQPPRFRELRSYTNSCWCVIGTCPPNGKSEKPNRNLGKQKQTRLKKKHSCVCVGFSDDRMKCRRAERPLVPLPPCTIYNVRYANVQMAREPLCSGTPDVYTKTLRLAPRATDASESSATPRQAYTLPSPLLNAYLTSRDDIPTSAQGVRGVSAKRSRHAE